MADGELSWIPPGVDITKPSAARVYDYYLGGACNLQVDREFAKQVLAVLPEARDFARLNRAFLHRAVRWLARQGVRQFIDIGSGVPTVGHTHEIAQSVDPSCRVVYVDNEPVAVAHSELLLADNDRTTVLHADLRDPDAVLRSPTTRELIDFDQPVAVMMLALLHFVPDTDDPSGIIGRYRSAMAPGSYLVLSHATDEGVGQRTERAASMYKNTTNPANLRTRARITELFAGFDILEPGVVFTPQWRPESDADAEDPERALALAAVGRKIGD
ncbi:MAG TPA: SAM-dependent methyltransferase [Pseudonocardiaceae bacterium]|jgi:hypothetical protein|nr:SAM-dependent methyltransferase [Pseudonocardiaceae bacterium]